MPDRIKSAVWLAWTALTVLLTAGIVRWHIEYFRSPGPQFYRAAIVGLPLLAAAALIWARIRAGALWRYELAVMVAIPAGILVLREPRAALVVLALVAACYAAGRALCRRCGWISVAPVADLVFSIAAGFAGLNTVLFVSGLARLWYPWFFALLLASMLLVFYRETWHFFRTLRSVSHRWTALADLNRPLAGILMPFAAILALCTTVIMLSPTLSWDAMKQHLPLSQYYLQVHALAPKPDLLYSFYPQATESVFALTWALGGQAAAQLVAPVFLAMTLLVLWIIARDCGGSAEEAFAGVMLALSLPVLHWAESVPKNDASVTFFVLAALAAALRFRSTADFKWVQAGTLFLAGAFAVKDLAILGAIPLAFVFLPAAWRQPLRPRAFASLAVIFAAVALIWNVRRLVLAGNPIFPLGTGGNLTPNWIPDHTIGGTLLRLIRLPWDLHAHGLAYSETVLIAPLGIVFVLLWPVWLFTGRPARLERLGLGFAAGSFLAWALLTPFVRYALVSLAVFALLTGVRLARFWRSSNRITRVALAFGCLWILIPALCAVMIVEINAPQLRYLAGAIDRDEYLKEALITYPSLKWLRDHTGASDTILSLENCSDVYALPFPRFQSRCIAVPWQASGIGAELRDNTGWVVAPPADTPAVLAAVRARGRMAIETYRDSNFVVFRLN